MKNIGSEQSFSAALPSAFTVVEQGGKRPANNGVLLELRTEDGPVFVRPSWWQRMRLRRDFRYFHVVPPQLLSQSHQRLIAKLMRTSVVTLEGSVAGNPIFGVVEKVHAHLPAEAPQLVVMRPDPPRAFSFLPPPAIQITPQPDQQETLDTANPPAAFAAPETGLWPWIVSGTAAAALIPLIMASVYGISRWTHIPQARQAHAAVTPLPQVAKDRAPQAFHAAAIRSLPALPNTQKHRPPAAAKQKAETALAETTFSAQPRFVSELPPGHFAHPVVATGNLVGEVRLKALIGADGAVKQVTVLSGRPNLAKAAMQAVKRWHYRPFQVLGNPVAVETEVKMSFFGPDAVSIASVADRPVR